MGAYKTKACICDSNWNISLENSVVLIKQWKQQKFFNTNENQYVVLLIRTIINYIQYVRKYQKYFITL